MALGTESPVTAAGADGPQRTAETGRGRRPVGTHCGLVPAPRLGLELCGDHGPLDWWRRSRHVLCGVSNGTSSPRRSRTAAVRRYQQPGPCDNASTVPRPSKEATAAVDECACRPRCGRTDVVRHWWQRSAERTHCSASDRRTPHPLSVDQCAGCQRHSVPSPNVSFRTVCNKNSGTSPVVFSVPVFDTERQTSPRPLDGGSQASPGRQDGEIRSIAAPAAPLSPARSRSNSRHSGTCRLSRAVHAVAGHEPPAGTHRLSPGS